MESKHVMVLPGPHHDGEDLAILLAYLDEVCMRVVAEQIRRSDVWDSPRSWRKVLRSSDIIQEQEKAHRSCYERRGWIGNQGC